MAAIMLEKIPKIVSSKSMMIMMGEDEIRFKNVQLGDENAFEILFKTYYARLCYYANSLTEDINEAEEIVQNMFLQIWEKRENINLEASFKSYIYKAVKNRCLNYLRNKKLKSGHLSVIKMDEGDSFDANDALHLEEIHDKLYEVLEELPPKCKQIFQMSRMEGLKHQEIANQLDLKVKTVENQIGIALKYLRSNLTEYLHSLVFLLFNLF